MKAVFILWKIDNLKKHKKQTTCLKYQKKSVSICIYVYFYETYLLVKLNWQINAANQFKDDRRPAILFSLTLYWVQSKWMGIQLPGFSGSLLTLQNSTRGIVQYLKLLRESWKKSSSLESYWRPPDFHLKHPCFY